MSILEENYDVICITETWLTANFKSEEYFPSSYAVFRRDRHLQLDTYNVGGGILIAVSNKFSAIPMTLSNCDSEVIAVRIRFHSYSLIICVTYIPCHSNVAVYDKFLDTIKTNIVPLLQPEDRFFIFGDFNLPSIVWEYVDQVLTPIDRNDDAINFISEIFSLGLKQCIDVKNSSGNVLDLAFVPIDHEVTVSSCEDMAGSSSIYHSPLNISVMFENCVVTEENVDLCSYNFKKGDYVSLNAFLDGYNWSSFYSYVNIDDMLIEFYRIINLGIDKFIPRLMVSGAKKEPWFNDELINLKNRKDKAHKQYKLHPNAVNYNSYNVLRKKYIYLNRFLYSSYILEVESQIKSNPNQFWYFVNYKRKYNGYPSTMYFEDRSCANVSDTCNLFADFFESVYNTSSNSNIFSIKNEVGNSNFSMICFETDTILSELSNLDCKQSAGADLIPPSFLKLSSKALTVPVCTLFNKSLREGYFPVLWKRSLIKPIFKSGSRCNVENYRGICIISVLPKLFEKLVRDKLFFHIKTLVSPKQHGFFPGRSTITNLLLFTNFVSKALQRSEIVQVVYTDFRKAFDKIDHDLLLKKIYSLECNFIPVDWIGSYLRSRTQMVKIGGFTSRVIDVTSGVPQGSHLGPMLFILFINDVVNCLTYSDILIYADDIKIFKTISCVKDELNFQSDLNRFSSWCLANNLTLNVTKCKSMRFTRALRAFNVVYYFDGCVIDSVDTFRDLGITFTPNLSFHKHIDGCISKANSMLGFIKRFSKDFCDPYVIKVLYFAFVRSLLEYGAVIWNPFYANCSDRIESIQKRFLMFSLRRLPRDVNLPPFILPPYRGRCKLLNIEPLFIRRIKISAIFVRDVLLSRIDCSEILCLYDIYTPVRELRVRDFQIKPMFSRHNYGKCEPVYQSSINFNTIRSVFDFNLSRDAFRELMSQFLLNCW